MPMPKKPPRILLRKRKGRGPVYVIKDGPVEVSTGTASLPDAESALEAYTTAEVVYEPMANENQMMAAARRIMHGVRERSRMRGMTYDIDAKWVMLKMVEQDFACAISGIRFSTEPSLGGRRNPFSASADRIDNAKGYTVDNVRLVAVIVNLARADFSDEEFLAMCQNVAKKHEAGARPRLAFENAVFHKAKQ